MGIPSPARRKELLVRDGVGFSDPLCKGEVIAMEFTSTPNGLPGSQGNETAAPPAGEPPSAGIAPRTTAVRAPRPPFVRGLPFIGNAWEMGTDPGAFFVKCYREAGPIFRIRLFNKPYTVLAGPEANRFIAREGTTHLRSKEFWQEFVDEFGAKKSLINTDGEMHDKIRKVMKRGYGRASISGRYQELIDITDRMLQDEWQSGQRLRVVPAMQRLAAEQLGIMVAGRAPGEYFDDLRVFIRYALNVLVVHMRPRIMLRMPDYRRAKKRIFELGQRMIDSYDPSRVDPKQPTLIDDIMAAAKQDETLFEGAELMAAVLGRILQASTPWPTPPQPCSTRFSSIAACTSRFWPRSTGYSQRAR